jgi:hypothetical protein
VVVPDGKHIAVGIRDHGHDTEGLASRLGYEADTPLVQTLAVLEDSLDVEGDSRMTADQGSRVRVNGGMDTEVSRSIKEFGSEGTLAENGQFEVVAIEPFGLLDVRDKDRD